MSSAVIKSGQPGDDSIREADTDREFAQAKKPAQPTESHHVTVEGLGAGEAGEPEPVDPVEEARELAQQILTDARREAEAVAETAYREGFEQGEKAGWELGQQKAEPLVKSLDAIVAELTRVHQTVLESAEGELIEVAKTIAIRILHKELIADPETVLHVAREAMKRIGRGDSVALRLNPVDLEYIQQSGSALSELSKQSGALSLEPDYEVLRGGVLIESQSGEIDATLESQLAWLWEALDSETSRSEPGAEEPKADAPDEGAEEAAGK